MTDPAGVARTNLTDALGRLRSVIEAGPIPTDYTYDELDDLITVTPADATRARSFAYDGLKRLTSASNPETGTVQYPVYDGNGNLKQKLEARNITTT